ncbi:MAG TPA: MarP family serine protease [Acidimicrobiales bacterium]|nr:MarP family serine protease [Acidimicrobiales bacterium]
MNLLDLFVIMSAAAAGFGGYRLGFVARAASWVGLAIGLVIAMRFLPAAVRSFEGPDPSTKLFIAAGVLLLGGFVGQGLGLLAGSSLRRFVPHGPLRALDSSVGALVGVIGILASVWLLLPAIADIPGSYARQARNSAIARFLDRQLPEPPDTVQALRRVVGDTNFPQVFEVLRPAPKTGPPPATTGIPAPVIARVSASTVKVEGIACDRMQEGSGFAVAADVVVTNAHVVAGHRAGRTQVARPDGRRLDASIVIFDPQRDLAVLRVPGLGQAPLLVGDAEVGEQGAVFGHPGGQEPLRIAPAAIREQIKAVGRDLYGTRSTRREVFILAAELAQGDSGGALVDSGGAVVGVAFAIAPDRRGTAYALTAGELRAVLALPRGGAVSSGPCLGGG